MKKGIKDNIISGLMLLITIAMLITVVSFDFSEQMRLMFYYIIGFQILSIFRGTQTNKILGHFGLQVIELLKFNKVLSSIITDELEKNDKNTSKDVE